jgi:anthranilate phosphoribosyltransferase
VLEVAAGALLELGTEKAFVVHSEDGLDEISIAAPTHVVEVGEGRTRRFRVAPEDFGFARRGADAVLGGDPGANAAILLGVFAGERGPRRDVVLMNAGVALVAGGAAPGFREGAAIAARVIDDGSVTRLLEALRAEAR